MPESGPRSGKNAPKKAASSKGKAKMTQAAWDKLSPKQRDIDYGGSRFMQAGGRGRAKEGGWGEGAKDRTKGVTGKSSSRPR